MRFVKRDNPEGDFVLRNCIGEGGREGSRRGFCSFLLILSATVWIEIGLVHRLGLFNVKKICV